MSTEGRAPLDGKAVLAALAEFWRDPPAGRFSSRLPRRIAGSDFDQPVPEGTENPYWEIIRQLPLSELGSSFVRSRPEPDCHWFAVGDEFRYLTDRRALCGTFAWSIPSPGDMTWIRRRLGGRGIVEVGAGGGYWAWQLSQAGVDVVAYDPNPDGNHHVRTTKPWHPVQTGYETAAKRHPDRALLLCWPTYSDPWAERALAAYEGDQLFYAGEGEGGCCADDGFFKVLDDQWADVGDCPLHVSYWGIHCYLTEYRRKA